MKTDKEILKDIKQYVNNKVNNPYSSKFMDEEYLEMMDIIDGKDHKERQIKLQKERNRIKDIK